MERTVEVELVTAAAAEWHSACTAAALTSAHTAERAPSAVSAATAAHELELAVSRRGCSAHARSCEGSCLH